MAHRLNQRAWLWDLLVSHAQGYDADRVRASLPPDCFDPAIPPVVRAKRAMRRLMRDSGLRYGTPIGEPVEPGAAALPAPEALFLAALGGELDLCSAAGLIFGYTLRPEERRRDQLAFLAALLGRSALAEKIAAQPSDAGLERRAASLAGPLWRRGRALVADPVLGLPLHNGLLYCDARFLGRLAMDSYRRGRLSARSAERLRGYVDRERASLAEALLLLARADHAPSALARRIIVRQLKALGLPGAQARALRGALEKPRPPEVIAASIRSPRTRRFILEQVVLGALADGWRSPRERRFLQRLAETLGIPPADLAEIETELAEFYAGHPDFVDRFHVRDRLADLADQAMVRVDEIVDRNRAVLLHEVREGRELTRALVALARGRKLDVDQRRRLRAQLLDLAKTVPGLALFAAPGGLLLVMALAKVLPPSFLPSMLIDRKPGDEESREGSRPP